MKKLIIICISLSIIIYTGILLSKAKPDGNAVKVEKKYKTPEELKTEEIRFKKIKRKAGWSKPDKPSEFVEYQNKIRTKAGDDQPRYVRNYKLTELQKAKDRKILLKSANEILEWKERGPGNVSGRTRGLIIDPDDKTGNTWFAGSASGGIWKTNNAGSSWTNLTPKLPNLSTASIAMAPGNTSVIYAGTGEGFYNTGSVSGDGIFKSNDKGNNWKQLQSTALNRDFEFVNRIIVDPVNENIVLAATNTSIQKSTNGGTTWKVVYDNLRRIQQIVAHPNNFNILYASANQQGVIKSIDAGETWVPVLADHAGRIELALSPSNPKIIYALNEDSELFISDDSGANWSRGKITSGTRALFLGAQGWYNNAIAVSPEDPFNIFIGGINIYNVMLSKIGGSTTPITSVTEEGTQAFMAYINHGGDYLFGGMEINEDKKNNTNIEVQFGPGKSQKAHRFLVPRGASSGVASASYSYADYVEVPFEVWDTDKNRQLMLSFRDQDRNGIFNLTPLNDNASEGREYIWINDLDYSETPSSNISRSGGHEYEMICFLWPVLANGAIWSPKNLPNSKISIKRKNISATELTSKKVADWVGDGAPYVHADVHNIQFVSINNKLRIVVSNDGGVGYSDNMGVSWANPTNGYNTTQFYGVDKHPSENKYIGGLQDNGTFVSNADPDHLSDWNEATGGDGFDVVWNAVQPEKLISSNYYNHLYKSDDGGESWRTVFNDKEDSSPEKAPFVTQIGYSELEPNKLYISGESGVIISEDFGNSWSTTSLPASNWGWTGIGYVEPSLAFPEYVWAASQMSNNASVMISTDGGVTFEPSNTYSENMGILSGLATHPVDINTAYALFSYADYPKILRTTNLGQSWEDISGFDFSESTNGFPNVSVYSLLVMPHDPNELWAGTEIGLFISYNNGESWEYANNGLPAVSIWEMKIRGTQIIVATHGRGIWSVDIPELANKLTPPTILEIGVNPSNKTIIQHKHGALYDSIYFLIDNNQIQHIEPNTSIAEIDYSLLQTDVEEGLHTFQIIAFKNGILLKSKSKSIEIIHYNAPKRSYFNSFEKETNDFTGSGFSQINMEDLEKGISIHSKHPYDNNSNLTYCLRTPIIVDQNLNSEGTVLSYIDIPLIEPGEAGSNYTSSSFYDYGILEASSNGLHWIPLLDGYDYQLVENEAKKINKDVYSEPSPEMFISHEVDLSHTFEINDTILIRFRLFSDFSLTTWGWVIDDIHISTPSNVGILSSKELVNSVYPIPCSDHLNIQLNKNFKRSALLTVYSINGHKMQQQIIENNINIRLTTTDLPAGLYILEIKSGERKEQIKFQVLR